MKKNILGLKQRRFLELFTKEKKLSDQYFLTGGTALAEYYIPYRYSEDLDFFSEQEIKIDEITAFIRVIKKDLGYITFEYNSSYNRNLFFLKFPNSTLKLEFTYYPFPQVNQLKKEKGIFIDSVEDIAVNKLFTIYQKPRSRDFMDLFMICQKYNYSLDDLVKKAKVKFDTHIDLLKLGSQYLLVSELKDYPKLIEPLKEKDWQGFFKNEAKKLKEKIITNTKQ